MTRELAFDLFFRSDLGTRELAKNNNSPQFVIVIVIVIAAAMADRTHAPPGQVECLAFGCGRLQVETPYPYRNYRNA